MLLLAWNRKLGSMMTCRSTRMSALRLFSDNLSTMIDHRCHKTSRQDTAVRMFVVDDRRHVENDEELYKKRDRDSH